MAGLVTDDELATRLAQVHDRIARAGGELDRITLVAVMKEHPDAYPVARACGLHDFGENRAHLGGFTSEPNDRLHFIGHIQRRDVRRIADKVHLWHTVERSEVGAEIAKWSPAAQVLVQVNISGEKQKHGCDPDDTAALVGALSDVGLDVQGLMGMGPLGPPEAARPGFRLLRNLADELQLSERSMGMSADLEVAVEEGATIVRVGSSLFA